MTIERTISDWIYKYDSSENKFEVIPNIKIQKPKTLFKYFSMEDHHIQSLINTYLWAAHPDSFNDLYDCYINICQLTEARVDEIRQNFNRWNTGELTKEECQYLLWATIYMKHGIVSMTQNGNDVLMWSYYTKNKGFAVEYDYLFFPFTYYGPFPMNYKNEFTQIKVNNAVDDKFLMIYMSTIKNVEWKHENEWRFIINAPDEQSMFAEKPDILRELGGLDRKFDYPIKAIKSVALANHFFEIKETNQINSQILNIILKEKPEMKSIILDFLFHHEIKTKIITRETRKGNIFDLDFRDGYITKTGVNQYIFNAID